VGSARLLTKIVDGGILVVALLMVLYHLLSTQYLFLSYDLHKNLHLAFGLVLVYLSLVRKNPSPLQQIIGLIFTVLSIAATGYVFIFYNDMLMRIGIPTMPDIILAVVLIVVITEATRKSFGIILPVFSLAFLAYIFFGHYIPGGLHVPYFGFEHVISKIALDFRGIYGFILGISADYIFLFIIFGAVMKSTGTVTFFEQVGRLAGKTFRGGSALSAITTSALFGMFTGAASSNVVLTGSFTIPAMKEAGYTPEQAGATEAAASTVGQVMPPIMGAAAFVMADFTDQPYIQVVKFATIPAVLTYFCMAVSVQLRAMKSGINPSSAKVDYKKMLGVSYLFFIPLILLMFLLVRGYSPNYTIFWSIIVLVGLSLFRKKTRMHLRIWVNALIEGAMVGSKIAVMSATIGMVVAAIIMSGLGITMPGVIKSMSGDSLIAALVLTMMASMILGLGMPTTAAYILVAFTVAPFLISMGLPMMTAHFFVFYFAVFSLVTPPVAPAVVTACALAKGRFLITGVEAIKLAIAGFVLPYLMIYCPVMLFQAENVLDGAIDIVIILIFLIGVEVVLVGHYLTNCNWQERLLMTISIGSLFIYFGTRSPGFLIGLGGFFAVSLYQFYKRSRLRERVIGTI